MNMARYVLTKQAAAGTRGPVSTPEQIRRLPNVRVVDQTGDRMILLEVDPKVLDRHRRRIRGWTVSPEVVYAAPWDESAPFS
jgi:hypothetical protein